MMESTNLVLNGGIKAKWAPLLVNENTFNQVTIHSTGTSCMIKCTYTRNDDTFTQ